MGPYQLSVLRAWARLQSRPLSVHHSHGFPRWADHQPEHPQWPVMSDLPVVFCGPNLVFVVFASPRRRDLWFLVFACSVLHWSVKFPPRSQVCNPKNHATVPSGSLFHHLPHHMKYKQFSQTIEEQNQTHCSSISKAATASAQQRRKQRQRHQRRQQQHRVRHRVATLIRRDRCRLKDGV